MRRCGALLLLGSSLLAQAAPDEIQVYTEELNAPGEFGLEQHLNYTASGQQTPDYAGQMRSHHALQVTPEFSYGLTDTLEAGLYLPVAFTPGGYAYLNGLRLRLKYIVPRDSATRWFHGLNVEVGRDEPRTSESLAGMELRPILGYRDERWLFSFNPILNMALSAGVSHAPQFEPSLKLTHRVGHGLRAGVEYYGEWGWLHDLSGQRVHTIYAVADVERGKLDINVGIGHGSAADRWVVKTIVALPF
ncbi:MAG: hypothetical protein Fur0040_09150 [Sideroxydans sp.]